MNAHDLMKAWDNAIADARARITRDEETNFKQISGMQFKSGLLAGCLQSGQDSIDCMQTWFNCTNRVFTCTWHNC